MNFLRTFFLLALPVTVSFLSGACSSAAAVCEQSACKSGNVCVNDGTEDKCRLPCAAPADCPAGYKCSENPGPGGDEKVKSFCTSIADVADGGSVPNISKITPKDKGQWGFPCNPSKGYANNPDCDSEQNFWCYAETPTDGEAYCTQYQCGNVAEKKLNNNECAGGYECEFINVGPRADKEKRTFNEVDTACIKRAYCSPCKGDFECNPIRGGKTHCAKDKNDNGYCTPECSSDSQCQLDADCKDVNGIKMCVPRAGLCVGDGNLCSPCRSDANCNDGQCVRATYSDERFCTKKSGVACRVVNEKLESQCPTTPEDVKAAGALGVSCITVANDPDVQKDQCLGFVQFGTNGGKPLPGLGCWTRARK